MEKKFDYQSSLHLIKSGLFDIYEDQEKIIGTIDNDKERKKHLDDFINLKNIALMLIEGIEYFYQEGEEKEEKETSQKPEIINQETENQQPEEVVLEEILDSKYYLDCAEDKLPFAYVPSQLYQKLKDHQIEKKKEQEMPKEEEKVELQIDNESLFNQEEQKEDIESALPYTEKESSDWKEANHYMYKEDEGKVRGIIVRSDQFMKLSLSKMRQEGVLEEAKAFRKKEVTKKRREEHQKKLKESEVKLNI